MFSVPHFVSGTGNVLKIQSLLHICSEFYSTEKKEEEGETEVEGKKGEGEEGGKETPMDEGSDTGMQEVNIARLISSCVSLLENEASSLSMPPCSRRW